MQIIKRNGTTESYDREKIAVAIRKSFISTQKEITDEAVYTIVDEVEQLDQRPRSLNGRSQITAE